MIHLAFLPASPGPVPRASRLRRLVSQRPTHSSPASEITLRRTTIACTQPGDKPAAPALDTTLQLETEALDQSSGSIVLTPSYTLSAALLALGSACASRGGYYVLPAAPVVLVGLVLFVQTWNIRLIFGPTRLSVAERRPFPFGTHALQRGWDYRLITSYNVWYRSFPLVTCFVESETRGGPDQRHLIPAIFDARQFLRLLRANTPHLGAPDGAPDTAGDDDAPPA